MSEVLTTRRAHASVKPRMRGWIHLASAIGFAASGTVLIALAATGLPAAVVAVATYVAGVLGLFGVSAVYHLVTWRSERVRTWMRRLDHSMIFLLIAGTYTPIGLLALPPETGRIVLGVVWIGAIAGMLLKLAWPHAPRWFGVPLYIALGWVAVFVLGDLMRTAGVVGLVLLLAGGVLYTVGAICYAARWPDPWPKTFGYHEVFHTAVAAAAICHHITIWLLLPVTPASS
ncbi:hemolysin III family protein [Saccharopolyspora sp. NPDC049426]|uniref:PAQR family membrane homeostasis protein TrhA n=1 Tax=Saccharopolyspora sp. NPDC049426 TaxID=3155652 RepID=UPI003416C5AC